MSVENMKSAVSGSISTKPLIVSLRAAVENSAPSPLVHTIPFR